MVWTCYSKKNHTDMLDRETIKTLRLIPELDTEKAKKNLSDDKPEPQPDESKFGSKETSRIAFLATQIAAKNFNSDELVLPL